jgi:hypothetical protein
MRDWRLETDDWRLATVSQCANVIAAPTLKLVPSLKLQRHANGDSVREERPKQSMLDTRYLMEKTDKESYFCFLFSDFCFLQISFNNERLISHFSFLTAAKYNIHTETEIK